MISWHEKSKKFAIDVDPNDDTLIESLRRLGWKGFKKSGLLRTQDITVVFQTKGVYSPEAQLNSYRFVDRAKLSSSTSTHPFPDLPGRKLRSFQHVAIRYALDVFRSHKGVYIADEMGTGKTTEAIAICHHMGASRVLVISPAGVRYVWKEEIKNCLGIEATMLDTGGCVRDGRGWFITNPNKLLTPTQKSFSEIAKSIKGKDDGTNIKKWTKSFNGRAIWYTDRTDIQPRGQEQFIYHADSVEKILQIESMLNNASMTADYIVADKIRPLFSKERCEGLLSSIMESEWDALILDEAHIYGNYEAKQTINVLGRSATKDSQEVKGIVSRCKNWVFLSGTPVSNKPKQLAPIISTLTEIGYSNFLFRYCDPRTEEVVARGGEKRLVYHFEGSSNEEELSKRLRRQIMVRRTKQAVLPELPEKIRQIVPVFDEKILRASNSLMAEAIALAGNKQGIFEFMSDAMYDRFNEHSIDKLVSCFPDNENRLSSVRKDLGMAKLDLIVDFCKILMQEKNKIVVMAHHRDMVDALATRLERAVKFYGAMNEEDKQKAVTDFMKGNDRVFVGSLYAAGVGITLTAADTMVFAEPDWVPSIMSQAEDRIHRIGQENTTNFYYVVADNSLESAIVKSLIKKQNSIDKILDPKESFGSVTMDEDTIRSATYFFTYETTGFTNANKMLERCVLETCDRLKNGGSLTERDVNIYKKAKENEYGYFSS